MATNDVLLKTGVQISFADHATDFIGGAAKTSVEQAGATDVQIDLTSLSAGAGRESVKFDFGATRARNYSIMASLEFATAPVTGEVVNFYLAPSNDATAANGNPQSINGADAAAPSGHSTLKELTDACIWIGRFVCSADATTTVQTSWCGSFRPPTRYGILIVVNDTSDAIMTDAVECNIVFDPNVDEIQAAA